MNNLINYLYFFSKLQPKMTAVQAGHKSISFEELLDLVQKTAQWLQTQNIQKGDVIVTSIQDRLIDYIFSLGLLHEGVTSCANHNYSYISTDIIPSVNCYIIDTPLPENNQFKTLVINQEVIKSIFNNSSKKTSYSEYDLNQFARIALTSGSTGAPKAIGLETPQIIGRLESYSQLISLPYGSDLSMLGLNTSMGYSMAMMHLIQGTTLYLYQNIEQIPNMLDLYGIRSIVGSPIQIKGVTEQIQKSKIRNIKVECAILGGGVLNEKLYQSIHNTLTPNILILYGAAETGLSAAYYPHLHNHQLDCAGIALPNVKIQIEDLSNNKQEGSIKISTPHMASQYLGKNSSDQHFKNGFFYPGDIGHINQNLLILRGRDTERLNIGGVKIDPNLVDSFVLSQDNISDAAAFGAIDLDGKDHVVLAVVADDSFDLNALAKQLITKFGPEIAPKAIMKVPNIPRNHMGKPLRAEMAKSYLKNLEKNSNPKQLH